MSRITTYRNITSLSIHDLLLVSDMGTIGNPTKTVTVGDLIDFGVGSGTPFYLPMWTSDGNLTDSNFYQTSTGDIVAESTTRLGIGTVPEYKLHVTDTVTSLDGSSYSVRSEATVANTVAAPNGIHTSIYGWLTNTSNFDSSVNVGTIGRSEAAGSGNGGTFYGVGGTAFVTGSSEADYIIGATGFATVNGSGARAIEAIYGGYFNVVLTEGTTEDASVIRCNLTQTAGTTITGDFAFLELDADVPTGVTGEARAIHSKAVLPSYFAGNIETGGSIKVSDDTDAASASKVGTLRYKTTQSGSDYESLCEMCMQTGVSTYAWVTIVSHTWQNM